MHFNFIEYNIFCKTLYDRNKQKNLILVNVENPLPEEYSVDLSEITEEVMVAVPGCAGVWFIRRYPPDKVNITGLDGVTYIDGNVGAITIQKKL